MHKTAFPQMSRKKHVFSLFNNLHIDELIFIVTYVSVTGGITNV